MHLRGQHKVLFTLAQTLFYMVGYNTQRMLSWRKAIGMRLARWSVKTERKSTSNVIAYTLNGRKLKRLFCVYWQYTQRYPLEIKPFAALQPGCGS